MPRKKRSSDISYNARRRFTRAAGRYLEKAKTSVGAAASRYREMARDAISKAAELYERKADIQRSGKFSEIAGELGVNLSEFMQSDTPNEREQIRKERLISESEKVTSPTAGTREDRKQARRDREAQAILNSPAGSRIYAGLVDVWTQPEYTETGEIVRRKTQGEINQKIMDYFGVNSMMDVIEILEKQIPGMYANPESMERYDVVSTSIMLGLYK